jgi:hypothetical protein
MRYINYTVCEARRQKVIEYMQKWQLGPIRANKVALELGIPKKAVVAIFNREGYKVSFRSPFNARWKRPVWSIS